MVARVQQLSIGIQASDAVNTTFTLDFGFQPTALILIWSGRSGVGIGRQDVHIGRGWAVSTTSRAYTESHMQDNLSTTVSKRISGQDGCMGTVLDGVSDGKLDLDAILTDGARFIIDVVFSTDITVHVLALGGDINQAFASFEDLITSGSPVPKDVAVTGVGFQPDIVLFMSSRDQTDGVGDSTSVTIFGGMVSATDQGAMSGAALNGAATTSTGRFARHGDIANAGVSPSGSVNSRFQFSSLDADGFTYNYLEKSDDRVYYLALAGGSYAIKEFLSKTDLTDIDVTVGFRPAGAVILSACTAEAGPTSDDDAIPKKYVQMEGMFSSPLGFVFNQCAHWGYDEDALSTSRVATALREDAVYVRGTEVASPAVAGQMRVKAIGDTVTKFVMDDADPDAALAFGIFFGPAAAPGEVQITASVEVMFQGQQQVAASVEVKLPGEVQAVASVEVKQNGEKTADASISVAQNGEKTIDASINVSLEQPSEVFADASINATQNSQSTAVASTSAKFGGEVQIDASVQVFVPSPPMGGGGSDFITRTSGRASRVLSRIRRRP